MTNPRRKALRTLLQAALGAIGAGAVSLVCDLIGWSLDERAVAIVGVALTAVITQVQNNLEETGTIPTFLPRAGDV